MQELEKRLEVDLELIRGLKPRQIKAMKFSDDQARGIVRTYYNIQDMRKITFSQTRAFKTDERPHMLVSFLGEEMEHLERMCGHALDAYSASKEIGQWARSIVGIGPIITAGLMSYIDITKAPVVSHIWRYAGLDPSQDWLGDAKGRALYNEVVGPRGMATAEQIAVLAQRANRNPNLLMEQMKTITAMNKDGERISRDANRQDQIGVLALRPWNAELKKLCWHIGESFNKFQNHKDDTYGKILVIRKAYEEAKNANGDYAEEAAKKLAKCDIRDPETRAIYESGKLTQGHLQSRAKRYAVKIFLSHYHAVAYELHYGEKPPKPFAIAILNHAHEIPVPNWPLDGGSACTK